MNCPRCHSSLAELDRDGITIDRCVSCRGIWLDRGELEKLVANASESDVPARRRQDDDDDDDDDDDGHHRAGWKGGRRRSWWEIFD